MEASSQLEENNDEHTLTYLKCNLKMLPSKLSYVFMHAIGGSYQPFFIVFFQSIGLSTLHAGFIVGFRMLVSCFAIHCCSTIGRFTKYNKYLFWLACFTSVITFMPIPWIAESSLLFSHRNVSDNCSSNLLHEQGGSFQDSHLGFQRCRNNSRETETLFFVMLSTNVVNSAVQCVIPGYVSPVISSIAQNAGQTLNTIQQRLYSAIGYGFATFLSGITTDYYHHKTMSSYTTIFYIYLVFSLLLILSSVLLFFQYKDDEFDNEESYRLLMKTCTNCTNILLFIAVVGVGFAHGFLNSFLFVLLAEMNASKTLMGFSTVTSSSAECLVFLFASKIRRKIGSPFRCIGISIFQYFLRFLLISLMTSSWHIIPIQMLDIVGFPLFWISVFDHIRLSGSAEVEDSMNKLISTFHFNIGSVIANIIGGIFYDKYPGKLLFRNTSFVYLIWGIILIGYAFIKERNTEQMYLEDSTLSQANLSEYVDHDVEDKILMIEESGM